MGAGASAQVEALLPEPALSAIYDIRPELKELPKEELLKALHSDLVLAKDAKAFMPAGYKLEEKEGGDGGVVEGVIAKVGHICRVVKDSEVAKKFYLDVVGARLLNRPKFATNGYWLWLGNTQLHLIESDLAMAPDHPDGGSRVNHISFDCYDFDKVVARVKNAGIKYNKVFVPLGNGAGINQIFFQDPDKHWIEICDCQRFNDFIFGEYDEARAEELRKAYLEGVEPKGAFMSTLLFMLMSQNAGSSSSACRDLFNTFAKGDGEISIEDMGDAVSRLMGKVLLESDMEQMKAMLNRIDVSKDGVVTYDEFRSYLTQELLNSGDQEALMDSMFAAIDKNSSGTITAAEFSENFKCISPNMPDEKIAELFSTLDKDGDSMLDRVEFPSLFNAFKAAVLK